MEEIAKLFASKYIARPDMKAIQRSNGDYNPVESKFTMADLVGHLTGEVTYGHYMLNTDNQCKLFAFDLDLDKIDRAEDGTILKDWWLPLDVVEGTWTGWYKGDPRETWLDRSRKIERSYFKTQLRMLASKLASSIHKTLEVPCAVTYTGAKGLHVYGFTGLMNAEDVRKGAQIVLDECGVFEPYKGNNFFKHKSVLNADGTLDPYFSYDGITIELFPKQVTLTGKTHGNLMRLPLGRNLKNPKDPTFFLDLRADFGDGAFTKRDPIEALTVADQWA